MTIQEEIRDRVIANIAKACPEMLNADIVKLADKILQGEASQGVVIKVKDRELPTSRKANEAARREAPMDCELRDYMRGYCKAQVDILKAGYVAVEPLI